eukprot:342945-Lingulodinium_polyedra.AAC.1
MHQRDPGRARARARELVRQMGPAPMPSGRICSPFGAEVGAVAMLTRDSHCSACRQGRRPGVGILHGD